MKWQVLAVSFTALFLEMMVIRWVPSLVPLIAFYANLMLLSSFLGLGVGAMLTRREKWPLFDYFPLFLALEIGTLVLCRGVVLNTSASESRLSNLSPTFSHNLVLLSLFAVNALVFAPLGQKLGQLFDALPRLSAYTWDLAGSLGGTVCFGLFSFLHFSPFAGMAGVSLLYLLVSSRRRWLRDVAVLAGVLALVFTSSNRAAIWSPYHYITIGLKDTPEVVETVPPPDLRTMRDPPIYSVSVNHFYYHYNASINPARYTPGTKQAALAASFADYYHFPYVMGAGRERALILAGGGGCDVLGALAAGVRHVDAVEIDPVVVQLSRRFNPDAPYDDPRVAVHVDDARAYLAKATPGYDFVVFGLLDSHALFSSMNNVRLDGYVYTVEGVRQAFGLLNEHGLLSLAFYIEKDWLLPKLYGMVAAATGRKPAIFMIHRTAIICVPKDPHQEIPAFLQSVQLTLPAASLARVDLPTDDWPFLYLNGKAIPSDYLAAIACLLTLSVVAIGGLRGRSLGVSDLHFGLLGMGFLLLETKSINDCALYFGGTWLVTAIVVTGVLLMVLAANLAVARIPKFSLGLYLPLFLALAVLLLVPREMILGLNLPLRLLWTLLVVPLPVFFAGLIFSTTFRQVAVPSAAFGANLMGAMVGGFCEYLAMAVGSMQLSILIFVAYLLSLLVLTGAKRRGLGF